MDELKIKIKVISPRSMHSLYSVTRHPGKLISRISISTESLMKTVNCSKYAGDAK